MANKLNDIIARVAALDPAVGAELRDQIGELTRVRPNGLNFERHIPEQVALIGRPITAGDKVKFIPERGVETVDDRRTWTVSRIVGTPDSRVAHLTHRDTGEIVDRSLEDLVYVADFRDPIYPGLRSTGKVERGGDKPFHTVINAENYHALEMLTFTHAGKIDAIYIDPPYNTRAKDWKYNNDYVDPSDDYAHSKWLSFMERRLKVAQKLLNPQDSVLIVTIDEKEYLRLGMLLEQTFPNAEIQMITSIISGKGVFRRGQFMRVQEYVFIVCFGAAYAHPSFTNMLDGDFAADGTAPLPESEPVEWLGLRRREPSAIRGARPNQFYPIYVDRATRSVVDVGEAVDADYSPENHPPVGDLLTVWPVRGDGRYGIWGLTATQAKKNLAKGYIRCNYTKKTDKATIYYLTTGTITDIEEGKAVVDGIDSAGSVIASYKLGIPERTPRQVWNMKSHNAEVYGTNILSALLPGRRFPFPKSLHAVEDVLRFFVSEKKDATILDFFSGSGTTAHALMRLNRQDAGRRQCISITNNEVSADEQKSLIANDKRPGDPEWEALGICDYITKPRIEAAVSGLTPAGDPIEGEYRFADEFPMAEGLEENVEFFTLEYLNPALVELDMAFAKIAPLLWMHAGSQGRRINERTETFDIADTYAVLFDVDASGLFITALEGREGLRTIYIVTDDEPQFQAIASQLPQGIETLRLYESYIRTFTINTEGA